MSTRLSVNINKVALLRNSRGSDLPNLKQVAKDCEAFGAEGITVHPRPDERHIHYADVPVLKEIVTTEFNIEGFPSRRFLDLVLANKPHQATLVPDPPGVLTSDTGWDTIGQADFLKEVVAELQAAGIRVSLFLDPVEKLMEAAKATGTDRIEFYTGTYAKLYPKNPAEAVADYKRVGALAADLGIGVNAGHDLNLDNLNYFLREVPQVLEVSIGHALISDALYYGLENTIHMYLRQCQY
ncbi:MAG: pyridoxine 5'-phosphate synthase [Bacteroidota bacterium]